MEPQPEPSRSPALFAQPRQLHPASTVIPLAGTLIRLSVPILISVIWIKVSGVLALLPVAFTGAAAYYVVRYLTLRYHLDDRHLVVRTGWLSTRERRIPLERIQDVELRQTLLHRLFNLARIEFTTAGKDEVEAQLDALSLHEAEALKLEINLRQGAVTSGQAGDSADVGEEVARLGPFDLAMGGLTSDLVSRMGALLGTLVYFLIVLTLLPSLPGPWEQVDRSLELVLPTEGIFAPVLKFLLEETIGKAVGLIFLGFAFAITRYGIRYYGFQLRISGRVLEKSHGLLTLRRSTLRCDRIQALRIEESLLRRWFGLATISADSAGDRQQEDDENKAEVLVPVIPVSRAPELVNRLMPGISTDWPEWQSISRKAIMRGTRRMWLLTGLLMLQTAAAFGWLWLAWVPALPIAYFLNRKWYQATGYCMLPGHFLSRKGWLNRRTLLQPIANIQNVTFRQTWLDRRLDLATLAIDAAGQTNTGGGAVIRNLPSAEARRLQVELARRTEARRFAW